MTELVSGLQSIVVHVEEQSIDISDQELQSLLTKKALPQLAALHICEYDPRTQAVRYYQRPNVEEYAHHAAIQELSSEFIDSNIH